MDRVRENVAWAWGMGIRLGEQVRRGFFGKEDSNVIAHFEWPEHVGENTEALEPLNRILLTERDVSESLLWFFETLTPDLDRFVSNQYDIAIQVRRMANGQFDSPNILIGVADNRKPTREDRFTPLVSVIAVNYDPLDLYLRSAAYRSYNHPNELQYLLEGMRKSDWTWDVRHVMVTNYSSWMFISMDEGQNVVAPYLQKIRYGQRMYPPGGSRDNQPKYSHQAIPPPEITVRGGLAGDEDEYNVRKGIYCTLAEAYKRKYF